MHIINCNIESQFVNYSHLAKFHNKIVHILIKFGVIGLQAILK